MSAPRVTRIWRGSTLTSRADDYTRYLSETGMADILTTSGNEGVLLLRRELGEHTRFSTVSLWRSESAIRAFSGSEGEQARLEPRDAEFLVDHEPIAEHPRIALASLRATEGSLWYPGRP